MRGITKKIYMTLTPPAEEDSVSDQERILRELKSQGISARLPLAVLRDLYPFCTAENWDFTISLAYDGSQWAAVKLEPGDTTACHYGYCADLGSTTLVVRLLDCATGQILGEASAYNHQIAFGEDILTRIFYGKDRPDRLEEIRQSTIDTFSEVFLT
ncbi:MAG: hypothetical protein ACLR9K_12105, partial [Blautia sp.]